MFVISVVEYEVKSARSVVAKIAAATRIPAASANFRGFSFRVVSLPKTLIVSCGFNFP